MMLANGHKAWVIQGRIIMSYRLKYHGWITAKECKFRIKLLRFMLAELEGRL